MMADFVQTMKDWRRMCKHYLDESIKAEQFSCADMCPLGHNTACGVIGDALDSDIEVMAKEIAKWAAEHPEPVYPTWGEWLESFGVVEIIKVKNRTTVMMKPELLNSIPADIAQKLGIEPKEG